MNKLTILIRTIFSGKKLSKHTVQGYQQELDNSASLPDQMFDKAATFNRINQSIDEYESTAIPSLDSKRPSILKIAASIAVFFILSAITYYYLPLRSREADPDQQIIAFKQIYTTKGQIKRLTLSDGTIVYLNADSKLEYPDAFAKDKRLVFLSGEAYFEVTKDKNRPFIIESNGIRTKVLGTSFNIKAYKNDEKFNVGVITGKVSVDKSNNGKSAAPQLLLPDEIVEFDRKNTAFSRRKVSDINRTINWIRGELHFSNTSLADFINSLNRKYGVEIEIDPSLKSRKVYADFNEVPVESILKILPVMLSCKIEKRNDIYLLKQ